MQHLVSSSQSVAVRCTGWERTAPHFSLNLCTYIYRGSDKSLARSNWKNNWNIAIFRPTRRSLLPRRPGWTDNLLNFFLVPCKSQSLVAVACFLPGRAKDLAALRYVYIYMCVPPWPCGPTWTMASSFLRFIDHTQRRTTVGRTPLNVWPACCRNLYLTTHNTHNRQIDIHPCPRRGSKPKFQQASDRRPTP